MTALLIFFAPAILAAALFCLWIWAWIAAIVFALVTGRA